MCTFWPGLWEPEDTAPGRGGDQLTGRNEDERYKRKEKDND